MLSISFNLLFYLCTVNVVVVCRLVTFREGLFNVGWYFWLHKFRHTSPISGKDALPGHGLLCLLHNGTCEAENTNLH